MRISLITKSQISVNAYRWRSLGYQFHAPPHPEHGAGSNIHQHVALHDKIASVKNNSNIHSLQIHFKGWGHEPFPFSTCFSHKTNINLKILFLLNVLSKITIYDSFLRVKVWLRPNSSACQFLRGGEASPPISPSPPLTLT